MKYLLTCIALLTLVNFAWADNSEKIKVYQENQQKAQQQIIQLQQYILITEGRIQELQEQDKNEKTNNTNKPDISE